MTIIITKASDKFIPNDPVIVKQMTDTIKLVHDYNIPTQLNNDTIRQELEAKIKNLELLNNYDKQIKERISNIKQSDGLTPNLILTQNLNKIAQKGYTYGSSSSYFSSDCPNVNNKYLDISFNFLNPSITKDIAFLRVNIYKFENQNSEEARTYISEDFYQVKKENNFIRINNELVTGKYEIIYGFMFANDINQEYPKFYFKRCIVTKG